MVMLDRKRKVVFIGSCSYSGSTIFDMLLGSSPDSRSLGEIGRAYFPQKKHHILRECGCLNPSCQTWANILSGPSVNLYERIFEQFEERVLIDSTKDPHWIKRRSDELEMSGVETCHVLLWKRPEQIRDSYAKRGLIRYWKRHWINFHRLYFTLIENFSVIPYDAILSENGDFEERIRNIDLEVNENFWESDPCILFGNDSARRHLHTSDSKEFNEIQGRREKDVKSSGALDHREIAPSQSSDNSKKIDFKSNKISQICNFLESNDSIIQSKSKITYPSEGPLRVGKISAGARLYFQHAKTIIPRLRWSIVN